MAAAVPTESETVQFDLTGEHTATRRLRPRPTSSEARLTESSHDITPSQLSSPAKRKAPFALIMLAVVLVAAGVIAWAALIRPRHSANTASSADSLVYPNSRTILNSTSDSGKAIQLQTNDSSDQVVSWYTANLKPTKTLQLTPTTVVLKNQTVTVTVVADDKTTTVLIKQAAP